MIPPYFYYTPGSGEWWNENETKLQRDASVCEAHPYRAVFIENRPDAYRMVTLPCSDMHVGYENGGVGPGYTMGLLGARDFLKGRYVLDVYYWYPALRYAPGLCTDDRKAASNHTRSHVFPTQWPYVSLQSYGLTIDQLAWPPVTAHHRSQRYREVETNDRYTVPKLSEPVKFRFPNGSTQGDDIERCLTYDTDTAWLEVEGEREGVYNWGVIALKQHPP